MVQRVLRRLRGARRHDHLGDALQREAGELFRRGERRDGRRARGALPRQLSGRRRHHRARLDFGWRPAEVPAQRRHELVRLHRARSARNISTTPSAPRPAPARPPRPSTSTPTSRPSPAASSRTPRPPTAPTTPAPSSRWRSPRPAAATPAAIKAAIREVVAADGEPIHAGKDEFAKALALIAEGKPVKYEGVIGPVSLRRVRRHHRPVPPLAHPGRRGHDHRRDERRRGRRDQGRATHPGGTGPTAGRCLCFRRRSAGWCGVSAGAGGGPAAS